VVYLYLTGFWQAARTLSGINTPHIPSPVILHPLAYEDGTDRGFRNVGYSNSDVGELPKRKRITKLQLLTSINLLAPE